MSLTFPTYKIGRVNYWNSERFPYTVFYLKSLLVSVSWRLWDNSAETCRGYVKYYKHNLYIMHFFGVTWVNYITRSHYAKFLSVLFLCPVLRFFMWFEIRQYQLKFHFRRQEKLKERLELYVVKVLNFFLISRTKIVLLIIL
jgi:hypothetical protein